VAEAHGRAHPAVPGLPGDGNPGLFTAPGQKDLFIWLRRFRSEAERKRLYRRVYENEHWKKEISPKIDEVMDTSTIVVTDLVPTPSSILQ